MSQPHIDTIGVARHFGSNQMINVGDFHHTSAFKPVFNIVCAGGKTANHGIVRRERRYFDKFFVISNQPWMTIA
jgi:hypothetical protein